MPSKEKLEVTPTKTGLIIRLAAYFLFILPLFIAFAAIGIEGARTDPGGWIILWIFMFVLLIAFLVLDVIEGVLGYFHRHLVLTEKECYYINVFGRKKEFQLDEVSYSVRYTKHGSRLTLRDGKGRLIASLVCDYCLENVEQICPFIDAHRKQKNFPFKQP